MSNSSKCLTVSDNMPINTDSSAFSLTDRTEYTIDRITERLDLLEQKVEVLPSLVAEYLQDIFAQVKDDPSVKKDIQVVFEHSGLSAPYVVDLYTIVNSVADSITDRLRSGIDYSELERLRARVRELEEDLGYRKKVANRLMEE